MELQKRQCTVRSHESILDKLLYYNTLSLSYIYRQEKYRVIVKLRQSNDDV